MRRAIAAISIGTGLVLIAVAMIVFPGAADADNTFINSRDGNSAAANDPNSSEGDDSVEDSDIPTAPEIGEYAPNFILESVSGEHVQLSDYKGKVVLLNFWAVWCPPCIEEMPLFQRVHGTYGDKLVILAVNAGDSREDAISFLESNGLSFEALLDSDSKVDSQYRVRGLPTSFFIDQRGIIQFSHIGSLHESQIIEYLTEMGLTD